MDLEWGRPKWTGSPNLIRNLESSALVEGPNDSSPATRKRNFQPILLVFKPYIISWSIHNEQANHKRIYTYFEVERKFGAYEETVENRKTQKLISLISLLTEKEQMKILRYGQEMGEALRAFWWANQ